MDGGGDDDRYGDDGDHDDDEAGDVADDYGDGDGHVDGGDSGFYVFGGGDDDVDELC